MTRYLWVLMALFAISASAADISGTWKGSTQGDPDGDMEFTCVFQANGSVLTGTVTDSMDGEATKISDGKIDGDSITFVLHMDFDGEDMKVNCKGKLVNEKEIKLTMSFPGFEGEPPEDMQLTIKKS